MGEIAVILAAWLIGGLRGIGRGRRRARHARRRHSTRR